MEAYRNYNIRIKGRVQDMGFRNLVENIARSLNLKGMVYNDIDGTVRIVCGGAASSVKSLVKELKDKCTNVGAAVEEVNQEEITGKIDFPPVFFKAPTDEFSDIGRKLDTGVEHLKTLVDGQDKILKTLEEGQTKVSEGQDKLIEGQDSLLERQDKLLEGQDRLVEGQNKMISFLQKIAEK